MLDVQTIRNLFEAYLQTSFLSPEDVVDLIRVRWKNGKILVEKYNEIRNEYLDNLDNDSEEHIEEYIDRMYRFIS